jgi:fibronectin-binding autotransporter adhesin
LTNASIELGYEGSGQMTVSNGTVQGNIDVCGFDGFGTGAGTLTVAGGTVTGNVDVSFGESTGVGTVWLTGGQIINESTLYLGDQGIGQMTVSNGMLFTEGLEVGYFSGSQGTLTIAGGTNVLSSFVHVGRGGTKATVWMTGGLLYTTNDLTNIGDEGGVAQVIVSNGTWQSQRIRVGSSGEAICPLTLDGGTTTVSSNLQIGLFDCSATGIVTVAGGSLYVTNAAHNATLDVESGTFTLNGGTVVADIFVKTNPCASFIQTGGTLIVGGVTNPFSPLPFSITGIDKEGNNMRISWQTPGGITNVVQVTNGIGGNYATNFTDLSPEIILLPGSGSVITNYLDAGGATNFPAHYYRVRLVP